MVGCAGHMVSYGGTWRQLMNLIKKMNFTNGSIYTPIVNLCVVAMDSFGFEQVLMDEPNKAVLVGDRKKKEFYQRSHLATHS